MLWTIFRFELAYHLKRPVTYLYLMLTFLFGFFLMASDAIVVVGGVGLVRRNAPFALAQANSVGTAIGTVFTVALVGTSLLRDFRFRVHELLFTTHLSRVGYLFGRFLGAYAAMLVVFAGIPLGTMTGSLAPWVDPEFLLPFDPWSHIQPFLLLTATTLLVVSAIFFAVGALTRSLVAVYTQGIALLVAWSVTQSWLARLDRDALSNAFDVYGLASLELTTRYWTVAERNALLVPLEGFILTNRLIWIAAAVVILVITSRLFRFEAGERRSKRPTPTTARATPTSDVSIAPRFGGGTTLAQLLGTTGLAYRHIVRDRAFIGITLVAAIDICVGAWYADQLYGVTTWPVTYLVAELLTGEFFLFMVILTTIFAGESVWRERAIGADQLVDAAPVATGVLVAGKIVAVTLALLTVFALMVPVGIGAQLAKGFTRIEPGLYAAFLFGTLMPWAVAVTLFAFAVHALAQNKFVGHVVLIGYWLGSIVASNLGLEHQLLQVGWIPGFTYSDMNGFGHFVSNLALSGSYAVSVGLMVTVLALLAWSRGTETSRRGRLEAGRDRWSPRLGLALGGAGALTLLFGGAIFYNTNVLNRYTTSDELELRIVEWERSYRPLAHLTPPRIVDVDLTAELWPERRAYALDGRYVVVNRSTAPIDSVLVNYPSNLTAEGVEWSRAATALIADTLTGTQLWQFGEPLAVGDTAVLSYRLSFDAQGFPNSGPNNRIVENGTFLATLGPSLGYNPSGELSDPSDRRKHDLPPRDRLPDLDDPEARANPQFTLDSDLVRFAATVSTAPDQIAVAPGYLVREWEEDGRRWFRYEMDRPIANFAAIVSARYTVTKANWNDVEISIYHHAEHDYNLGRMTEAIQRSLDYYTEHFSPYQFREVRILEFPRYAGFAQSFSATIPYSESIGFITRVRDEDDDLDMPFFVTAHEVAHQWWGHQVVGARAQGSAMMVESMAEYAALTVMEQRYGASHARKFLRYELDRYLRGRTTERIREQPLVRTENQAYIHYNKGALALYALRDYIGEPAMNRALRGYLAEHAFESAPYSTARDFIGYLRAETPDSLGHVIEDLFETITLWDNRAELVEASPRDDGRWDITVAYSARKVRADSLGYETEIPMADYVDIGVFGPPEPGNSLGKPLLVQKVLVREGRGTIDLVVDEEPERAGIDPYNKLIDRVPSDNVAEASSR